MPYTTSTGSFFNLLVPETGLPGYLPIPPGQISLYWEYLKIRTLSSMKMLLTYTCYRQTAEVSGGFVPGNNKKVMLLGGTRTVEHCSGETKTYQVAATQVVSHEMGHCLGLPHTFEQRIGTTIDLVRENACVDPNTCQFISDCSSCNVTSNPTMNMTNVMSYTVPNCMSAFSEEQVNVMRHQLNGSMSSVVSTPKDTLAEIPPEIIGPSEVYIGSTVKFEIPDLTPESETYEWSLPEGFLINNTEEGNYLEVWVGPTAEGGTISVKTMDLCGASNEWFKPVKVSVKDCLDCPVADIFPNPASSRVYVNFRSEGHAREEFESHQEYTIIDLNGRSVFHTSSTRKNLILEVSDLDNGLFVLIIKNQHSHIMRYKLAIAR